MAAKRRPLPATRQPAYFCASCGAFPPDAASDLNPPAYPMSLRDYFAACAVPALIAAEAARDAAAFPQNGQRLPFCFSDIAAEAYQCADFLLLERSSPSEDDDGPTVDHSGL